MTKKIEASGLNVDMQMVADVLDKQAAIKLILELGGVTLYVPKPNREIIKEVYQQTGFPPKRIAAICGCSLRTVYRAIEDLPPVEQPTGKNEPPG